MNVVFLSGSFLSKDVSINILFCLCIVIFLFSFIDLISVNTFNVITLVNSAKQ